MRDIYDFYYAVQINDVWVKYADSDNNTVSEAQSHQNV